MTLAATFDGLRLCLSPGLRSVWILRSSRTMTPSRRTKRSFV